MTLIALNFVLSHSVSLGVLSWRDVEFQGHCYIYWNDRVDFFFQSVYMVDYIYQFMCIEPDLHLWDKPTWSCKIIFFIRSFIDFVNVWKKLHTSLDSKGYIFEGKKLTEHFPTGEPGKESCGKSERKAAAAF